MPDTAIFGLPPAARKAPALASLDASAIPGAQALAKPVPVGTVDLLRSQLLETDIAKLPAYPLDLEPIASDGGRRASSG
jgi:hypothetical protein